MSEPEPEPGQEHSGVVRWSRLLMTTIPLDDDHTICCSATSAPPSFIEYLIVSIVSATLLFCGLSSWPWDHDEVATLIEMGVLDLPVDGAPLEQLKRLPKLVPVWYSSQHAFLTVLPRNEFGTRVLGALCGTLTLLSVFYIGGQWRGRILGWAFVVILGTSQCFIWLSQQNRFYSMAMLFLVWSLASIWYSGRRTRVVTASLLLTVPLAVLSHNLLVVVYGIAAIASICCLPFRLVPVYVAVRSSLSAVVAFLIYFFYLRPLMTGWVSGDTGGTNELVSFIAQIGIPTIALAGLGATFAATSRENLRVSAWWIVSAFGGCLFVALSPWLVGNWNPRYALFFMMPLWFLATLSIEHLSLRSSGRIVVLGVFAFVILLQAPKLASHYRDGSRHDFRAAADFVASHEHERHGTILTNWPMTLKYYLQEYKVDSEVEGWRGVDHLDKDIDMVIYASNANEAPLSEFDSRLVMAKQFMTRRFDEQSHLIRIYLLESRPTASR